MSARLGRWLRGPRLFWIGLFAATWALSTWSFPLYKALGARWIIRYPRAWELPLESWLSAAMTWLVEEAGLGLFTFRDLTRAIAAAIEAPYRLVRAALIDGFSTGIR